MFVPIEGPYSLIEWRYASPWRCCIELSPCYRLNQRLLSRPPEFLSNLQDLVKESE